MSHCCRRNFGIRCAAMQRHFWETLEQRQVLTPPMKELLKSGDEANSQLLNGEHHHCSETLVRNLRACRIPNGSSRRASLR